MTYRIYLPVRSNEDIFFHWTVSQHTSVGWSFFTSKPGVQIHAVWNPIKMIHALLARVALLQIRSLKISLESWICKRQIVPQVTYSN